MLEITTLGQTGKPHCVLLHGFGIDSAIWKPFAELLSQRFQVHLVDLPGYGINHAIDLEQWDCHSLAEMILPKLPERALWIGWSLGGMLATYIAAHFPARVTGLITIASNAKFLNDHDWEDAMEESSFVNFSTALQTAYHHTINRFLALTCLGNERVFSQLKQLKHHAENPPSTHTLNQGLNLLRQLDLRPLLGSIRCPVRQVYGERDTLVPFTVAQKLEWLYPSLKSDIIEKAGHAPFLSHPTQVLEVVDNFYEQRIRHHDT